jgi:voltage-gated potassium channel
MDGAPPAEPLEAKPRSRLRRRLAELYHGQTPEALRFRLSVIGVDLLLIGFFIVAPFIRDHPTFLAVDYAIAVVAALEVCSRALAAANLRRWLRRPSVLIDLAVLATLLLPFWLSNFAFLRVLRLWSVFHSEFFWNTVGRRYDDTRWEDVTKAVATFLTYIFVVTGFVYALYARHHPHIDTYVDALYFTVATASTTGFGDVTLPGTTGRLISIVIMISGITLFVRLAQAIFVPAKVWFSCPGCALRRHDADAVHCKACGLLLEIPNKG